MWECRSPAMEKRTGRSFRQIRKCRQLLGYYLRDWRRSFGEAIAIFVVAIAKKATLHQ